MMFGLGFWELFAIVVVAVLFLKPGDIPAFLRSLGRFYGLLTGMYRDLMGALEEAEGGGRPPLRTPPRQESAEQRNPVDRDYRGTGQMSGPGSGEKIENINRKEESP